MGLLVAFLCAALSMQDAALAQPAVACGPFTMEPIAVPAPRGANSALRRFEAIKRAVQTEPYRVLFLGDSLTEFFWQDAPLVWREHMAPRLVLNAGVSGDRTEHLLWRLQHGNLDGPTPAAVVLLIGTNDLANFSDSRPPELAAEGIRANLVYLRQRLPGTRILLLGLLPRASPAAPLRRGTEAVNRLIATCGDNRAIFYADIGNVLLDGLGRLPPDIAPDQLHFSMRGYDRLARALDPHIDRLLAPP